MKRWQVLALATGLAGLAALASCRRAAGEDPSAKGGPDAGRFDKSALLRAFGQCANRTYAEFRGAAGELAVATQRLDAEGTAEAQAAAEEAWRKAIDAWERADALDFGPASATTKPGGKDLRTGIYAWPLVSRCQIEQQLVDEAYARPDFPASLANARGLAAVEYLLFHPGADNACPASAPINAQGSWGALGEDAIRKRKRSYARAAAADVAARAGTLADAWDEARGNFVGDLAGAGTAASRFFSSQQMAFNAVSDGTFYIDDVLKTMKVAKPAGLVDCGSASCLEAIESPWAGRSKEHLKNNLIAFERLLLGCEAGGGGLGWDDLLVAVGASDLEGRLRAADAEVRAALDALTEGRFEGDIANNPAGVKRLFDALRGVVALLKSEFLTVLDLELPKRVEGDND